MSNTIEESNVKTQNNITKAIKETSGKQNKMSFAETVKNRSPRCKEVEFCDAFDEIT